MSSVIPNVPGRLDGPPASTGGLAGVTAGSVTPDSVAAARTEAEVRWRPSRHARRLVTLAVAGLLLATVTRRPELVGQTGHDRVRGALGVPFLRRLLPE